MNPLASLAPDWPDISRLLDQALDLPAEERRRWLESQDAFPARVRLAVQRLLEQQAGVDAGGFLLALPAMQAQAPPADDGPVPGESVGPWHLLRELGHGGMGSVYLAERSDGGLRRQVALKLPRMSWVRGLAARMARERDILATLEHPHIARLYDAGVDERGRPWLALEYVQGQPLDAFCRQGDLPLRARVQLLLQVCAAVAYAHGRLVIHRDLKPGNILVTDNGQVRLLDFGIAGLLEPQTQAALTVTGVAARALTPQYASPEQVAGQVMGTASDVYSLGVVAFMLLAEASPYRVKRGSAAELEDAVLHAEPASASTVTPRPPWRRLLRGDLDAVLAQALRKAPAARYATVDALAADLQRWLDGLPVQARRTGAAERAWRWVRRHALFTVAGSAAVLALAGTAALAWRQAELAREETSRARKEAGRALAVQGLLLDIFRMNSIHQADPLQAQKTTARELLDLAAERAGVALKDAPESQLEVLGTLGDIYVQLALPGKAVPLLRERLRIARETLPLDDPGRAAAALSMAARLFDGGGREEARGLLAEAAAVLDRAGPAGLPQRARWHVQQAMFARYEDLSEALRHVEAALAGFAAHDPDAQARGQAFYMASTLQALASRPDRAVATVQAGWRVVQASKPGLPAPLLGVMSELASHQRRHGQWEASEASSIQAMALAHAAHGPNSRVTLVTMAFRADQLMETGRGVEAQALQAEVRARIAERSPPFESWWLDYIEYWMRRHAIGQGRPDLAEPVLRRSVAALQRDLPRSGVLAQRMRMLAEVLTAQDQPEEAAAWLGRAVPIWQRFAGAAPTPGHENPFRLATAELALARGRPEDALRELAAVMPSPGLLPGAPDLDLARRDVRIASAQLLRGQAALAQDAANHALQRLRGLPEGWHAVPLEADAWSALAQAQRALLQPGPAEASRQRALQLRQAYDLPGSVHLQALRPYALR
jgi:serine/threonine-protein kinase